MIYAIGISSAVGLALGSWLTWLIMRAPPQLAGSPSDPAVIGAIENAGAPATIEAQNAAHEILTAPDSAIDARVRELLERGRTGK